MFYEIYLKWIILGIICVTAIEEYRPLNAVPPVPGIPINTDPTDATSKTASTPPGPPKLSDNYLPACMQLIAYYVELIQYEPLQSTTLEPPFTGDDDSEEEHTQSGIITTSSTTPSYFTQWSRPTTTTTTTKKPVAWWETTSTTTRQPTTTTTTKTTTKYTTPIPWYIEQTTHMHSPGYFAPPTPPAIHHPTEYHYNYEIPHNALNNNNNNNFWQQNTLQQQQQHPSAVNHKPQTGSLPILSVSNNQFFDWFLQSKPMKKISDDFKNDLEYVNQLPAGLLQDIEAEPYEQPTILDEDNVNEFLKIYDDFYGSNRPITGKKKVPPTRPYVQMLMLYDLLKREAKRLMLNTFEGYSPAMLEELNETAKGSAERQLYVCLKRMIKQGDVDKADVVARVTTMLDDLVNPYSVTSKALRYLPPLPFTP